MDSRRHAGGAGEYRDALGSPEIRELLTRSDTPDVRQHLAIIKLINDIPPDGSSRSLRILPARPMLPWRRRSRRSLAPTQTARPGGQQETNVPRSDRKRQTSWRHGHRPPAGGRAGRRQARRGLPRRRSCPCSPTRCPPNSPPRVPRRNSHPSASRPPRAGRNSGSPCADLCPWFTGRDRVTVMASLVEVGKRCAAAGDEVLVKGRHLGDRA